MYKLLLRTQCLRLSSKPEMNKQKINLKQLQPEFKKHFEEEYKRYELPLLSTEGVLSYTSRFAKTVINLQYNENQRKQYYTLIKKSYNSNKKFTPQSCVDTCESLINFSFEGEQNKILEKIRAYAKANEKVLSGKQADRLIRAHKFIMSERADGPIKFIDLKLNSPKTQTQLYAQRFKKVLKEGGITQSNIDWVGKKQLSFEIDLYGLKRVIKMMALDESKSKFDEIEVVVKRINQMANKGNEVIIINTDRSLNPISSQTLAEKLLKNDKIHKKLHEFQQKGHQTYLQKLITRLLQVNPSTNTKLSHGDNISYLNYILENNTQDELKELFGYAKMNMFHIEFEEIMLMINRARKISASHFEQPQYTNLFEQQEHDYYKMVSIQELAAKSIHQLLAQSQQKRLMIYCSQKKISSFLHNFFKLLKAPLDFQKPAQNRKSSILMNKLTISSLFYQIPLSIPALHPNLDKYQQLLHPITYPFRFK